MARPLLIIEFSGDAVAAGLFPQEAGKAPSYLSLPSRGSVREDAARALESIREKAGADPAECAVFVGVVASSVSIRSVSVPMESREKINEILPFELAGTLSSDTGELVMDNIPLGGGKAIAVAMEKRLLGEYLEAFAAVGIDPVWVGVTGFSIPGLLQELYPEEGTKAFIGPGFISVSRQGRPLFFNSFSGAQGLKLNLSYLEAESIKIDSAYCAEGAQEIERLLSGAGVAVIEPGAGLPPEGASMAALALAVKKGLSAKTVNLRKGEFEYTKEKAATKKRLRLTAVLALVIAALLLGDAYLRYASVDRSLASYKTALRAEYTRLFPNEKVQVDEIYQISAKVKEIEREAALIKGGPGVLELMGALAKAAGTDPAMGIRLLELSVAGGKLKATGEAASFDAANRFKNILSEDRLFKGVQISDLKSKGAGAAFSLIISTS